MILFRGCKSGLHCLNATVYLLLVTVCASAADHVPTMADSLMAAAFYDEAITEYKRFLFFNTGTAAASRQYAKMGYCYAELGDWERSIESMDAAIVYAAQDSLRNQRRLDRAAVLIAAGRFEEARFDLDTMFHHSRRESVRKRAGVLLLLSKVLTHDWNAALSSYRDLSGSDVIRHETLERSLIEASQTEYKSPDTAVLLSSFIPGAGQAYSGHWLSGINALILNGAFAYITGYSIVNEHYGAAILTFLFLLKRYYNGNRYQAYQAAVVENEKTNERLQREILDLVREALYP